MLALGSPCKARGAQEYDAPNGGSLDADSAKIGARRHLSMRSIGRANWRRRRTRKALTAAPGSTQTEEITSWRGALQSQITAALLDALQTTVGIGCLVRIVLVEAGMHAGFAGGFIRVLRRHGRGEDRVPRSPRRRGRGGRRSSCCRGGCGIGPALSFAKLAPALST